MIFIILGDCIKEEFAYLGRQRNFMQVHLL